jgi:ABC-2 type transport system permease protein
MSMSMQRIRTVARRDYLYTVRRKAFLFTLFGAPLLYALLMLVVFKSNQGEGAHALRAFDKLGVVDSSGLFQDSESTIVTEIGEDNPFGGQKQANSEQFHTRIVRFDSQQSGEQALRDSSIFQLLIVPARYPVTGELRRYTRTDNLFAGTDQRVIRRWLVQGLLGPSSDSTRLAHVTEPLRHEGLYALNRDGQFELKNEARETLDFLLPLAIGMLLGLSIVIGGQYLLQGVTEEKESRILESMMCTVSPGELLGGKLIGLGAAGLTIILGWILLGTSVATPALGVMKFSLPPQIVAVMLCYFLLGYLFYGSLMTGIGSIASNMREAQQFSVWFTFLNFIPFYMLPKLVGHPNSALAIGLSLFPPTAPVTSMLRLVAPGSHVPGWQLALSMALLAGSAIGILMLSARLFRVGMLMYGKTPNLPEILRWLRQT